jgi:hypothetical protein
MRLPKQIAPVAPRASRAKVSQTGVRAAEACFGEVHVFKCGVECCGTSAGCKEVIKDVACGK